MQAQQGSWLPARASLQPDGLYLALRRIAAAELRDAFMQETIVRLAAPESFVQVATADLGRADSRSVPAGIVFHVARCGSTLVAQLLKQHGGLVVYAEPLPLNELLVPPHRFPRAALVAALRSLGAAFAAHAGGPWILKCSSWNTLFCDLVAEAFPAAPWVLCLRDPGEVAVSLLRELPGWLRRDDDYARQLSRVIDPDSKSASPEEYLARTYGAFCEAACRLDTARGRLVDYRSLPQAVWELVAPHFGAAPDARQRRRMADAARLDAKAPVGRPAAFASDSAAKQAAASPALRQALDAFARGPLERLRRGFAAP